ncbi:MAG: hypothetical protein MUF18_03765 [Fimbriiglobus sp.]|nr:hypothetical protein [Fimbriiglobus sp.]
MPNTPPPVTVWAEDVSPERPPPRTEPPRHAHDKATELLDRIAGGTRTRRPSRTRPAWWGFAVGVGLLVAAGVVAWFRLDLGLVYVPTVALTAAGLVVLVKALMGYR